MPFNGSGTFVRLRNWVNDAASGIKIRADRHDSEDDNFASGLTQCITKDGQTTITANLPMATYRHTGVGAAAATTDYARADQVRNGSLNWVVAGGTADALTATYTIPTTTLADGQIFHVRATAANTTTTPTLAVDGLTAYTIVKDGGDALAVGDIPGALAECIFRYNLANTRYELLNPASASIADGAITTAKLADDAVETAKINDLAVTTGKIADDAVTLAKMAGGTAGNLITYDASGDPAAVATGTSGQVLTSNGAGAAPTMQDLPAGISSASSLGNAITANATITFAHGLGAKPVGVLCTITCTDAGGDNGYAQGQEIVVENFINQAGAGAGSYGCTVFLTSTNANVELGGAYFIVKNPSTEAIVVITNTKWEFNIYVIA